MRRYQEALELVEKVNKDVADVKSAARKAGLDIARLGSILLLESEKHGDLPVIEAAAVHASDSTKEKSRASLFSPFFLLLFLRTLGKAENRPQESRSGQRVDI